MQARDAVACSRFVSRIALRRATNQSAAEAFRALPTQANPRNARSMPHSEPMLNFRMVGPSGFGR